MSEQKTAEELIAEAFERGRQQGAAQEHALWQLAAIGQEIEPSPKPDRPMLSDERSDSVRALGKAHDVLHNCRTMLPQSDGAHAEIEQAMAGIRWVLNCIRADREGQS